MAAGVNVSGGVDGIFGMGTAAAVKQFQSAKGLSATGVVDEATAAALAGNAPAAAPSSPLFGLKIGATGDAVRQLQATLVARGFKTKGDADGTFGVNTVNALTSFQYAQRIKVTGQGRRGNPRRPRHPRPRPRRSTGSGASGGTRGRAVESAVRSQDRGDRRRRAPTPSDARRPRLQDQRRRRRHVRRQHRQRPHQLPVRPADQGQRQGRRGNPRRPRHPRTSPRRSQPAAPAAGGGLGFAAYGERGGRVTTLQQALINAGITVRGGADGIFGSGTAAAILAFQKAKGIQATGVVDQATAQALGLTPGSAPAVPETPSMTLQAFPVQGKCFFGDTWHVSRGAGRLHEGVDIGAAEGKNVYAVADGRITKQYLVGTNQLTGNGLILRMADGTYFFYAHLLDFAPGIGVGTPVKAGQIIGYVGTTGNSGVPHLHFEVHPKGGAAINPYPLVKAINGCGTTTPPAQP